MNFHDFLSESEFRFEGETVGIITAHNPQGKKLSTTKNKALNLELAAELRAKGFDPWSIKGQYNGTKEDAFLIPDITRSELIKYAEKYNQKAIIWAKKADKGYVVEWIERKRTIKKEKITNIRILASQAIKLEG